MAKTVPEPKQSRLEWTRAAPLCMHTVPVWCHRKRVDTEQDNERFPLLSQGPVWGNVLMLYKMNVKTKQCYQEAFQTTKKHTVWKWHLNTANTPEQQASCWPSLAVFILALVLLLFLFPCSQYVFYLSPCFHSLIIISAQPNRLVCKWWINQHMTKRDHLSALQPDCTYENEVDVCRWYRDANHIVASINPLVTRDYITHFFKNSNQHFFLKL